MKNRNLLFKQKLVLLFLLVSPAVFAQENTNATEDTASTEVVSPRPHKKQVKSTFENAVLINNQTVQTLRKKSLDFIIQHRFGIIDNSQDIFGLFAPSNIRLGLTYGITNRLSVGAGVTKNKLLYDLNWKYAIIKQTQGGGIPVSVSYFGNINRSAIPKSNFYIPNPENKDSTIYEANDRYSYFNEIMIARKFNEHISIQLGATWSHVNLVDSGMKHDIMGVSFVGRYKFSPQSSVILEFDYPFAVHDVNKNMPNLGIGYEVETSGHTFQIFICTADGISNQQIMIFNQNDFSQKQILLGFNIGRLWSF